MSDHALPVPYTSRLLDQIHSGQTLIISGRINPSADRFEVNLLNNTTEIGTHGGTAPFHVSVRFDEGKVVLNSFENGGWGHEERHNNPFKKGEPFDIRIRVHDDKYELTANQKHLADYKHRETPSEIDHLQVKGDITLNSVHWGGRYFDIPFNTRFHGGHLRTGQQVFIYGVPKGDFSVNFVGPNGDNLFHFNPRFGEKKVVRNSQKNGEWENEEREGSFPFIKNTGFDLVIRNESYSIQIFVNGQRYGTFAHRTQPNNYNSLRIEGDIEVTGIEVSH